MAGGAPDAADCDRSPDEPPKTNTFQLGIASTAHAAWFHRGSPNPVATSAQVCVSVSNVRTSWQTRDGQASVVGVLARGARNYESQLSAEDRP